MDRFTETGHLTREALRELLQGEPEELHRLEAAEHLSFCDDCLAAYTALLDEEVLAVPQGELPLKAAVLQRIRGQKLRQFFSKAGTVAAAAVLTAAVWGVGINRLQATAPPDTNFLSGPVETLSGITHGVRNAITDFFGGLYRPAEPPEPAGEKNADPASAPTEDSGK